MLTILNPTLNLCNTVNKSKNKTLVEATMSFLLGSMSFVMMFSSQVRTECNTSEKPYI